MSAEPHADAQSVKERSPRRLLDELCRCYRHVLITDERSWVQCAQGAWESTAVNPIDGSDCRPAAWLPLLADPRGAEKLAVQLLEHGFLLDARISLRAQDGGETPVSMSVFPVTDDAGRPGSLRAAIVRPSAERGPRPEPGPLVDDNPEAILGVDAAGFIDFVNPAGRRLLGFGVEGLEGAPLAALAVRTSDLYRLLDALGATMPVSLDLELRRAEEGALGVTVSIAPRRGEAGEPAGHVLTVRPSASREETVAELVHRNQELEHFVNSLAHDLRSPLVALLGFSRLLRQDYGERLDPTGLHFIDRIEQSGRTMEALIHDLLELSRIGRSGEQPTLIDPKAVLAQLAAELKPRFEAEGAHLELPDAPPLVYCDRTRLYQVFSNLIGNALDHMGPDASDRRVRVDIRCGEGFHQIEVSDRGRGIDPAHHERIFEAFQSLGTRSDGRRGTGIGLAIVRRIAETRGGRTWVESRPDRGATFYLTLPVR